MKAPPVLVRVRGWRVERTVTDFERGTNNGMVGGVFFKSRSHRGTTTTECCLYIYGWFVRPAAAPRPLAPHGCAPRARRWCSHLLKALAIAAFVQYFAVCSVCVVFYYYNTAGDRVVWPTHLRSSGSELCEACGCTVRAQKLRSRLSTLDQRLFRWVGAPAPTAGV